MAKRKRLTPARTDYLAPDSGEAPPETRSSPLPGTPRGPISQVSGDAATRAALDDLAGELREARDSGRLIQSLPLDAIDMNHLVRDRVVADDQEMDALMQSIRTRGQQHPVEVVQLGAGRYGLISGWRRMTALSRLHAAGESGFDHVLAMLRRPETAADAYLSMVEENEVRVGLSYYERARIAAKATEQGVYSSEKAALLALFASASRAKRSKIRSFLPIYHELDAVLRFAAAIPERLGLRLSRALVENPGLVAELQRSLTARAPDNAESEAALIETVLEAHGGKTGTGAREPEKRRPAKTETERAGIEAVRAGANRILLQGPGVDDALLERLKAWLKRGAA